MVPYNASHLTSFVKSSNVYLYGVQYLLERVILNSLPYAIVLTINHHINMRYQEYPINVNTSEDLFTNSKMEKYLQEFLKQ